MHHTGSNTQQDHVSNFRHDPVPLCMAKKWLPVSHRHGCAIYRHENISTEQQGLVGGELMVSAIIKGSPEQCLAALTDSNSSNSILGPATAVEVLQQAADGSSKVRTAAVCCVKGCWMQVDDLQPIAQALRVSSVLRAWCDCQLPCSAARALCITHHS